MAKFRTASTDDIEQVKVRAKILLVTATDVETREIHAHLRPLWPRKRLFRISAENQTYYIGRLGCYGVIHVQCQMGSVLPGASGGTVADAIALWGVKAVIMVGIAFGTDEKKQRIGDVFISKTVIPYEVKREGKREVVFRNPIPPAGATLLNRFTNARHWQHSLLRKQQARVISAQLLSGESLIDNRKYLAKLLKAFPQAEGGEMEGAGIFAAAHEKGVQWILVKAICDFADGKKHRGKKLKQHIAATAAASLCAHVFSQSGNFDSLGCLDLSSASLTQTAQGSSMEDVLFEVYEQAHERAYLERNADGEIGAILSHQGLWVIGPTGCGKTSALRRNLCQAGKPFAFVDLSRCVGDSVPEVFAGIHMQLADAISPGGVPIQSPANASGNGQSYHIDGIAKLIGTKLKDDTFVIIDEIPLDGADFIAFSQGIGALVATLSNRNFRRAPILIASLCDPKPGLERYQKKVYERIRLLQMQLWPDGDISSLLDRVAKLLPLGLSKADKARVVAAAVGSPRSLKQILRTWCMFRNQPGWSLDRAIAESNICQYE